ncbi:MAG: alpha/beta hydrolase [Cyanobacteria bacterium J06634_5]
MGFLVWAFSMGLLEKKGLEQTGSEPKERYPQARRPLIFRMLALLAAIYSGFALYVFFFADGMIFLPPAVGYEHTPEQDETAVLLTASDGNTIAARYLHNPNSRITILFSHGNASDLGSILPNLQLLRDAGYSVFAYDYPGYGHSTGKPTEGGTYRAIEAAYAYLTTELKIAPETIVAYGQSVGGGPSTFLAANEPLGGLILQSTFATVFQVVVPFRILPFEKFPTVKRIDRIDCPLLLIHGTQDRTIPFSHSEELLAAAVAPKQLVPIVGADHNDILWVDGVTYLESIESFISGLE